MNFDYKLLSDPELSLEFIEENLSKFSKAEFNILSIFNKHITQEFIEKYNSYPWAHFDFQVNLLRLESLLPLDYNEMKKQNVKELYNKCDKFEPKNLDVKEVKNKHIKNKFGKV